jgi:putative glutathione S-transferase
MGMLVDGVWHDVWYDTKESKGHFKRAASQFRNWITADGSAGPSGAGGFKAEAGRYHLYVSLACPWAHRTLIFRRLKKLEDIVSVCRGPVDAGERLGIQGRRRRHRRLALRV